MEKILSRIYNYFNSFTSTSSLKPLRSCNCVFESGKYEHHERLILFRLSSITVQHWSAKYQIWLCAQFYNAYWIDFSCFHFRLSTSSQYRK